VVQAITNLEIPVRGEMKPFVTWRSRGVSILESLDDDLRCKQIDVFSRRRLSIRSRISATTTLSKTLYSIG
jgi:hypothetical protein